jgi:hypothetical protein
MANVGLPAEQGMVIKDDKPKRRLWLWACAGCTVLLCLALGIVGFIFYSVSNESYPLNGQVSFPASVKKDDTFDFVITVTNPTTEPIFIKHFTLQKYIGLPSLLEGARVKNVAPEMESEPISENELQYPYFQEIKSGETLTVIFHMQAENTGTYFIDVGVYARHPSLADPAFITAFWFGPAQIEITP